MKWLFSLLSKMLQNGAKAPTPEPVPMERMPLPAPEKPLYGIDISKWQGEVDWELLKLNEPNVDFVYIKATEGVNFVDKNADRNAKGAESVGIPFGFYHFATPSKKSDGTLDARDEARDFVTFIEKYIDYGYCTLTPVLDLEKETTLTGEELEQWVHEFADEMDKLEGYDEMILYTYVSYIRKNFADVDHHLGVYDLWLAHYTKAENPADVTQYGFPEWTLWQYSDDGTLKGIKGNVDENRATRLPTW